MGFCTECGTSLDLEASKELFCFNCGAQLLHDDVPSHEDAPVQKTVAPPLPPKVPPMPPRPSSTNKNVPTPPRIPPMPPLPGKIQTNISSNDLASNELSAKRPDTLQSGYNTYGIILTDSRKIAKQCRSTSNDIFNIIKNYTHQLSKFGHQYIIFDYDSTRYQNNNWQNYVIELSKFYDNQSIKPEYLFIIGGDEIIPMPVIDNESGISVRDYDYETDIPYAYLMSYGIEDMVWDCSLYRYKPNLYVGRLPFGIDFEKRQLTSYFDKVIDALNRDFSISNCFSLSARNWQKASETVLANLELNNKFIDFSPEISLRDVEEVFDTTSDILYFNLHGNDAPEDPCFSGDKGAAISPIQISNLENYNVIITEACYGAKFIGYNTDESMLLNSLNKNTLTFIGSSRIAFGAFDHNLDSADIIAHSVLGLISKGYSMGQALSIARIKNLKESQKRLGYADGYSKITAIEFNLYGEPTLRVKNTTTNQKSIEEDTVVVQQTSPKLVNEIIYSKSSNQNILDSVRASVDLEFEEISRIIQAELYNKYQLTSNDLQSISLQKNNSNEDYLYTYSKKHDNIKNDKFYFINCSKSGSIIKVITTK